MIRTEQPHLPVVAQSDMGMNRKNNEDRFQVTAYRLSKRNPIPVLLGVLSDGIGGHRAGEVAAELAVNGITQKVADSDASAPLATFKEAIESASDEIYEQAQDDPERQGMGGTCACAWIIGDRLYTTNVGDSRIYLMRGNAIQQVSSDHTWIQEALEMGLIKPEQIPGHPNAHVIRRYMGSPTPPQVDFRLHLNASESDSQAVANQGLRLQKDDVVLLCSDGLTDLVNPLEILQAFRGHSLSEAVKTLTDLANQRGGHDNITMIAIGVPMKIVPPKRPLSIWRLAVVGCFSALTVVAVVAAVWLGRTVVVPYLFPSQTPTPTRTSTSTITPLPSATPRPTPTVTPTFTDTPTSTQTVTPSLTVSPTIETTATPWPTIEPSKTQANQDTASPKTPTTGWTPGASLTALKSKMP